MNAKNIILAILMVLSFAACSSEIEGIDDTMPNTSANNANGTTSISVRMTTNDVNTKSGDQNESAVSEGSSIKTYVIAVFEKSGARIGYATSTSEIDGGNVTSTTIENIDTKEGEVDIIAVANINVNDFNSLYTYDEFANHIVRDNLTDFVKVGMTSTTLAKGQTNSISIDLVQLTARVKVELKYTTTGTENNKKDIAISFEATGYKNKIATSSIILNPVANAASAEVSEQIQSVNASSFSYNTYALNTPTLIVSTNLTVVVDKVELNNNEEINVPFMNGSDVLSCLENGKIYTQVITVNINFNISQDVTPTITYEVAPIREIENEITFN